MVCGANGDMTASVHDSAVPVVLRHYSFACEHFHAFSLFSTFYCSPMLQLSLKHCMQDRHNPLKDGFSIPRAHAAPHIPHMCNTR